jgi:hypothetical protein
VNSSHQDLQSCKIRDETNNCVRCNKKRENSELQPFISDLKPLLF